MAASRPLRSAARAAAAAEGMVGRIARPTRNVGFPYRPPTTPRGVEVPADPPSLGADYDTRWARTPLARAARGVLSSGPLQLAVHVVAHPEIRGHDRLVDLVRRAEDRGEAPPPVIFTPNHHSHVDTGLMVRAVPAAWRPHLVTAAAADYFFDRRWKARLAALGLNAIPVDRESAGRRSADQMAGLIERGWSLVIYPEGGRSPDGWGQPFKGGAAYLANRTGAPVVPVHIDGTDSIFAKGMKWPQPGRSIVTFGRPLWPATGESTRRLNERIERAVAELADEAATDYWSARRRAGAGATPTLLGPEHTGWRRAWDLTAKRERGIAGWNRRPSRRWPDLG
jgi:1-acyl-sn-glycerol-3-phosphate acyltransferase